MFSIARGLTGGLVTATALLALGVGCGGGGAGDAPDVDAEPTGLRVDAGADLTIMAPTDSVTLRAVVAGADGAAITVAWTQLGGQAATLAGVETDTLLASDLEVGSYAFRVDVATTDESASDEVTVTVISNQTLCEGPTVHVAPDGDDGNDGSEGAPWATVAHAASAATTFGTTIRVAPGSYLETTQIQLAEGVCLEGAGASTVITSTLTEAWTPIIKAWSPEGSDGHQHISGLYLDGQDLATFWAIEVAGRSNVAIYDVTVVDFLDRGVIMTGRDDNLAEPPATWATGLSFHDSTILNSAAYSTAQGEYGRGGLNVGGTEGMQIYANTIVQDQRPLGFNGWPIKAANDGHNRGLKIYGNTLTKIPFHGAYGGDGGWDFAVEMFHDEGTEFFANTVNGAAFDTNFQRRGSYPYSLWLHDNVFSMPGPQASNSHAVILEFDSDGVIVEDNVIERMTNCFSFTPRPGDTITDVTFAGNLCASAGLAVGDGNNGGFINVGSGGTDFSIDGLYIYNNTFLADPDNQPWWGIELGGTTAGTISDVRIINNILANTVAGPIVQGAEGGVVMDGVTVRNNIMHGNTQANAPVWTGTPPTNYEEVGNLTSDPQLVGDDQVPGPGSPAIDAGFDVGRPFTGAAPDIGYAES